jgi:polyisoprenoid-binding protein YceI
MKKHLAALIACAVPALATAAPESYTLDPFHTYPNFWVEHWGMSMVHGRFDKTTGKFSMDRSAKTGAVELTIDATSVNTGDNDRAGRPRSRDEHLRAADFFNVAEFPRITFRSTKVNFGAEMPSSVDGTLTMLGVSRPVTLTFERFKCGQNPFNKKDRCGGNAVAKVKRSDFGMKTALPAVGDELTLNVSFEGDKD